MLLKAAVCRVLGDYCPNINCVKGEEVRSFYFFTGENCYYLSGLLAIDFGYSGVPALLPDSTIFFTGYYFIILFEFIKLFAGVILVKFYSRSIPIALFDLKKPLFT